MDTKRLWNSRNVQVGSIVVGALRSVTNNFNKWIGKVGISDRTKHHKAALFHKTARILRKVLKP